MSSPKVLVIGAGIGGLATAARLASQGLAVTIVEKNAGPGGRCRRLVKDGYYFINGPTLFLMPQLFAKTFRDLGEQIDDHLELQRLDPSYALHFEDGSQLMLSSDLSLMKQQLEAMEPGSFAGFLRFLEEGYRHYQLSLPHLVERNFNCLWTFCNPKIFQLLFQLKALVKHYDNIRQYFRDPRLRAAFSFQNTYVGLSPFEAPALYSILQYTEFADGVWYPKGGMYAVIESLMNIARARGVQFVFDAQVEKIDVNGTQATGVTLADGTRINADIIVANPDLPYVYRALLPEDGSAGRLEKKRYSCSALIFFWGVDRQYTGLEAHNLFLAGDYRLSFDQIFRQHTLPDDPSFYVHAPASIDPQMAPEGHEAFTVMVPVGHLSEGSPQDWEAVQSRARQIIFQRLKSIGIDDLEKRIQFELSYTPKDWLERDNLIHGATHGLSHDLLQMAYLRPRNRHDRYHNLYFVGASTHPGTGMPTVLVSARLVTERILDDLGTYTVASRHRPVYV